MRTRILFHLALAVCVAALATTGCKSRKKAAQPGGVSSAPTLGDAGGIETGSRPPEGSTYASGRYAPVYFDFDSTAVRPSELPKLQTVAADMRSASGKLIVEGHADERGTAEYNRALGERRAQATREELVKLGVPADNISTVSYGEERAADPGHDEAAWSKNRRCDFVVAGQ